MSTTAWRRAWAAAAALVAVSILILSVVQRVHLGGGRNSDKIAHGAAYLALGLPLTLAATTGSNLRRTRRLGLLALAACVAYGAALELLQGAVGRDCDIADLLANVAGALAGWSAARAVARIASGRARVSPSRPPRAS